MSKFGWDLPPGCSLRDIPGNGPEDEYNERLMDKVYRIFPKCHDVQMDRLMRLFNEIREEGYQQATSDAAEAQQYKDHELQSGSGSD